MTRPLRTRRLLATLAVAPLLSAGLVACGDDADGGSDSASDASAESSSTDEAAETDDLEEGAEVEPAEFIDTLQAGLESSTTGKVTMKTSVGSSGEMTGEGEIDYTTSPPQVAMSMSNPMLGDATTEVRSVDGVMYISLGEMSQGKFWKIDPADPNSALGGTGLDQMMNQTDPIGALEDLEPAMTSVVFQGEEEVDGRDLDRYELTVGMAEMLKSTGQQLPPEAKNAMPESITYDVWLDEEERFSQMLMEMPIMGQTTTVEMAVTDWGTDVTIEAPPAGEVTEMPDLGAMMGGTQPKA